MDENENLEDYENVDVEPGNIVLVEVTNIADFGVFVRCKTGEEGLIHILKLLMNLLQILTNL